MSIYDLFFIMYIAFQNPSQNMWRYLDSTFGHQVYTVGWNNLLSVTQQKTPIQTMIDKP